MELDVRKTVLEGLFLVETKEGDELSDWKEHAVVLTKTKLIHHLKDGGEEEEENERKDEENSVGPQMQKEVGLPLSVVGPKKLSPETLFSILLKQRRRIKENFSIAKLL